MVSMLAEEWITKCLGEDICALLKFSPKLEGGVEVFFQRGGTVSYGLKNGSSCYRRSYVIRGKRVVVVESILIEASLKGNPLAVVRELSHEAGHAAFPFKFALNSTEAFHRSLVESENIAEPRAAYFRNRLRDEGAAIATNIEVRREILRHGLDIGLAGNPSNHGFYNRVYDALGNTPGAWERMGAQAEGEAFSSIGEFSNKKLRRPQSYHEIWDKEFQKLTELLSRLG